MRSLPSKRLVLVLAGILWFELSCAPLFSLRDIKPDFFALFLAFYVLRVNWREAVGLAFCIGLIQDLVTNSFFGLQVASYIGSALFLRFFSVRFDREKKWIQLAGLFSATWLIVILFSAFSFTVGTRYFPGVEWMFTKSVLIAAYTTVFGFVLFPWFDKYLLPLFGSRQYELFAK